MKIPAEIFPPIPTFWEKTADLHRIDLYQAGVMHFPIQIPAGRSEIGPVFRQGQRAAQCGLELASAENTSAHKISEKHRSIRKVYPDPTPSNDGTRLQSAANPDKPSFLSRFFLSGIYRINLLFSLDRVSCVIRSAWVFLHGTEESEGGENYPDVFGRIA
jgi:hypothetical protein